MSESLESQVPLSSIRLTILFLHLLTKGSGLGKILLKSIRLYLFGGEIEWMKIFGEKMERKTFLSVFGWW